MGANVAAVLVKGVIVTTEPCVTDGDAVVVRLGGGAVGAAVLALLDGDDDVARLDGRSLFTPETELGEDWLYVPKMMVGGVLDGDGDMDVPELF